MNLYEASDQRYQEDEVDLEAVGFLSAPCDGEAVPDPEPPLGIDVATITDDERYLIWQIRTIHQTVLQAGRKIIEGNDTIDLDTVANDEIDKVFEFMMGMLVPTVDHDH